MSEEKRKAPLCTEPWHTLNLGNRGLYRPCCHVDFYGDIMPESTDDISKIFKAPGMVSLRKQLLSGEVKHPICQKCLAGYLLPQPTKTEELKEIYDDFPEKRDRVLRAKSNGGVSLDYCPLKRMDLS